MRFASNSLRQLLIANRRTLTHLGSDVFRRIALCPLLAQSGHRDTLNPCLLLTQGGHWQFCCDAQDV